MSIYHLGEFEEIVLLTVAILNGEAYGVSIVEEIETRLQRNVSLGAAQTVLKRLENKRLVKSTFGEATKVRGGKGKGIIQSLPRDKSCSDKLKKNGFLFGMLFPEW